MTTETEKKLTIKRINKRVLELRTETLLEKCVHTGDIFLSQTFYDGKNRTAIAICISCIKYGLFW
ncbi:TPA: hypothetical protein ACJEU7_002591 [Acinetobacter baumannii]|uniref:hypothetical protein n=1 Tax=Acinetobacter baumannii TaxID=470 RepID=UPI001249D4A4|nr:hypothetical protein [Acinetobacter baumannii]KAB1664811.1 hypothetical protein F8B05_20630 [Acinetobacter baumannii]MCX3034067.1 hypothetical protein [Acinetobacter baumannii]